MTRTHCVRGLEGEEMAQQLKPLIVLAGDMVSCLVSICMVAPFPGNLMLSYVFGQQVFA